MDPNESILIVCRVTIGTGERQALRSVNFGPTFVAASVVRRLSDGTVLAVGVAAGHDAAATQADLTRIADQTDVSPSLADSGTWLAVN